MRFDFEATARRAERVARLVLRDFLTQSTPSERLVSAMRATDATRWVRFEGQYYRAPPAGSHAARALDFLGELAEARGRIKAGDAAQAAHHAFLAALAFSVLLEALDEREVDDGS